MQISCPNCRATAQSWPYCPICGLDFSKVEFPYCNTCQRFFYRKRRACPDCKVRLTMKMQEQDPFQPAPTIVPAKQGAQGRKRTGFDPVLATKTLQQTSGQFMPTPANAPTRSGFDPGRHIDAKSQAAPLAGSGNSASSSCSPIPSGQATGSMSGESYSTATSSSDNVLAGVGVAILAVAVVVIVGLLMKFFNLRQSAFNHNSSRPTIMVVAHRDNSAVPQYNEFLEPAVENTHHDNRAREECDARLNYQALLASAQEQPWVEFWLPPLLGTENLVWQTNLCSPPKEIWVVEQSFISIPNQGEALIELGPY